jgi:hypothetical protein
MLRDDEKIVTKYIRKDDKVIALTGYINYNNEFVTEILSLGRFSYISEYEYYDTEIEVRDLISDEIMQEISELQDRLANLWLRYDPNRG